jgi:hypothetical protein
MTKLKGVLERALPDITSLGGGGRNVDRDLLVDLLRGLGGELSLAYWLRCGVALITLAILILIIGRYGDQPPVIGGAATAMAITLVGALVTLKQVIDEMARVNTILQIAPDLSLEALTEVVRRIVAAL